MVKQLSYSTAAVHFVCGDRNHCFSHYSETELNSTGEPFDHVHKNESRLHTCMQMHIKDIK